MTTQITDPKEVKLITNVRYQVRLVEVDDDGVQWYSPHGSYETIAEAEARRTYRQDRYGEVLFIVASVTTEFVVG
jgi:hypothetical protein